MALDLLIYGMKADNEAQEKEKTLIQQYCDEMGITFRIEPKMASVEKVMSALYESSTKQDLKKIFIEVLFLLMLDDVNEEEQKFAQKICAEFHLTEQEYQGIYRADTHLLRSYELLAEAVQ